MDSRELRNKRRREEPEDAPTDPTMIPASTGGTAEPSEAVPGAVLDVLPAEGSGGVSDAVPEAVPDAVLDPVVEETAGTDPVPNAAFEETAGTDPVPNAAFGETAGTDPMPNAAFVETASPGPIAGDPEGSEETLGQEATEAAQVVDVGTAAIPDLQWNGEDVALNRDLPFTGRASASHIESTLSPLWRLATRLVGDPATREARMELRQRFAYFVTTPGAIETLLSLIPVLGEPEEQELLDGPMDAVDPGANQLGAILEYLPVVRPTQDAGVLTTDLVTHHSEQQARALTGLFLHTIGITSVDVRTMIGNENLGLMRRAFWRGRELLIQQLGAWMFRCINSFQTLRALDGQWSLVLEATELPTTLQAPNCPEGERGFLLAELLQISQERQRRMAAAQQLPIPVPDDGAQVIASGGTSTEATSTAAAPGHVGTSSWTDRSAGSAASTGKAGPPSKPRPSIALLREAQAKARALILLNRQVQDAERAERRAREEEAWRHANRAPPPAPRSTDSQLDSIAGFNANAAGAVHTGGCIPFWDSASPDSSANVVPWCNTRASSVSSSSVWWWVSTTAATASTSSGGGGRTFARLCRDGDRIAGRSLTGSSLAGSGLARSGVAGSNISYYATRWRNSASPWWRGRSRGIRGREFAWLVECFPRACFGRPLLLQCEKSEAVALQVGVVCRAVGRVGRRSVCGRFFSAAVGENLPNGSTHCITPPRLLVMSAVWALRVILKVVKRVVWGCWACVCRLMSRRVRRRSRRKFVRVTLVGRMPRRSFSDVWSMMRKRVPRKPSDKLEVSPRGPSDNKEKWAGTSEATVECVCMLAGLPQQVNVDESEEEEELVPDERPKRRKQGSAPPAPDLPTEAPEPQPEPQIPVYITSERMRMHRSRGHQPYLSFCDTCQSARGRIPARRKNMKNHYGPGELQVDLVSLGGM